MCFGDSIKRVFCCASKILIEWETNKLNDESI